ncbi:hypothetical protein TNCV_3637271 [Trichonephila clavipes]|nr:hypothetical protein TNCV_3637271 [Trichonephila clavipes]
MLGWNCIRAWWLNQETKTSLGVWEQGVKGHHTASTNLADLWTALANILHVISVERFQKLVESMPRRVAAIIKARGDPTRDKMRVANILGVAGTDVPIREIIKLTPPHRLGVNGYSFVVTNNGFVLYHPDLRPLFQDMLKPEYNQVDMAELELVDDDKLDARVSSIQFAFI